MGYRIIAPILPNIRIIPDEFRLSPELLLQVIGGGLLDEGVFGVGAHIFTSI